MLCMHEILNSRNSRRLYRIKMAPSSLKGTRKTYSFEEREILITLINKYEDIEEKKTDPISMCKRKSAWTQLANEYNSMVGAQGVRSAVQLRRCWENMKACKRNREGKKIRISKTLSQLSKDHGRLSNWEHRRCFSESTSAGNVGLPPNVVFEPKDSEPFTLQSVCTLKPFKPKKEDSCRDSDSNRSKSDPGAPTPDSMAESVEKCTKDLDSPAIERDVEDTAKKSRLILRPNGQQPLISPSTVPDQNRRTKKSAHREDELHVLALSEAQMKVDIAVMLKEEARIKLEEAHYRKEEARLRMLFFTYKLDGLKEN